LIQLNENFKYKFEATLPEPEVCTDCLLARITIVNVIASDYSYYVIRATSEDFNGYSAFGRVKLYGKYLINIVFIFYFTTFISLETPECQQSITNQNNKGCRNSPKLD
jgi:hypothetical protein